MTESPACHRFLVLNITDSSHKMHFFTKRPAGPKQFLSGPHRYTLNANFGL